MDPVVTTDDGTSLQPYLEMVRRWRRPLLVAPVTVALLVGIISMLLPRYYVARSSFVAQEVTPARGSGVSALAATFGIPQLSSLIGGGTTNSPQFYADLIQSKELLHTLALSTYTLSAPKPYSGNLVGYLNLRRNTENERQLATLKRLRERILSIQVDRPTGIVHVAVRTTNSELSAQVGRRLLTLLNEFNLRRRQGQVAAEREFTERRATEAGKDLFLAEDALAEFQRANRQYGQSPQLTTQFARLQRRVDMAQQLYSTLAQQFELARVESVRNTPVVTVIDAPESLVEPESHRTVEKTLLAFSLTLVAVLGLALVRDRSRKRSVLPREVESPYVSREATMVSKKRAETTSASA
jgi:uncharacterized protein involved in exopolysaccharide biosynthesis